MFFGSPSAINAFSNWKMGRSPFATKIPRLAKPNYVLWLPSSSCAASCSTSCPKALSKSGIMASSVLPGEQDCLCFNNWLLSHCSILAPQYWILTHHKSHAPTNTRFVVLPVARSWSLDHCPDFGIAHHDEECTLPHLVYLQVLAPLPST